MTMIFSDPETGLSFQEVVPGSPEDPFSTNFNAASAAQTVPASPAEPSVPAGTVPGSTEDGPKSPTGDPATATGASTQAPVVPQAAPPAPATPTPELSPAEKALKEGRLDDYIAEKAKEAAKASTEAALRAQQSSYDKRITALQAEAKAAREAAIRLEREGKLEGLSEDERSILQEKWKLEDEKQELLAYHDELDGMYRAMYLERRAPEAAQFGVTVEELAAIDDPDEMDAYITQRELEFYRNGGSATRQAPNTAPVAATAVVEPEPPAPAGATAPTDLGGSAPAPVPTKLNEGTGLDIMAQNLKSMSWETVRLPS